MNKMTSDLLAIRWIDPVAKGWTDILPVALFAKEGPTAAVTHAVIGPQGEQRQARCRIEVRGDVADLDYEPFPAFNNWWGMCLGIFRLHFTDKKRTALSRLEWKDKGRKRFSVAMTKVVADPLPAISPYKRKKGAARVVQRKITERLGQVHFRSTLMFAYGGKCCVTGCSVRAALEGSHIDPFSETKSDHPQNGLLLRHDLHALFDKALMAVDPDTRLVHFAFPAHRLA